MKYIKMKEMFQQLEVNNESNNFFFQEVDSMVQQQSANYFGVVKKITRKLQYSLHSLYKCMENVSDLFQAIAAGRSRSNSKLYHCQLKKMYFDLTLANKKMHSCNFESYIIKVQRTQREGT